MKSFSNIATWKANLVLTKCSPHYRLVRRYVNEQTDYTKQLLIVILVNESANDNDINWQELLDTWTQAELVMNFRGNYESGPTGNQPI